MKTKIMLPEPFFFEGSEKAVLLLHAYTGSANDVRLLGRRLHREGYTVYGPQLAGHATERFEDILEKGNPAAWMQDVENAIKFLKEKGYDQIAVFGLSLGGILATRALELDHYIGGGSFNSPIFNIGENRIPAAFANLYRSFERNKGADKETIEQGIEEIQKKLHKQMEELSEFSKKVQKDIGKINVPYYIASSQKDELIAPINGKILRDALVNAKVDYQEFPESTHVITVGANREPFEESLLAFLAKLNWKEG